MCAKRGSTMEAEFDVKPSDVAEIAVVVGKDKILQVCNFVQLLQCMYITMHSATYFNF